MSTFLTYISPDQDDFISTAYSFPSQKHQRDRLYEHSDLMVSSQVEAFYELLHKQSLKKYRQFTATWVFRMANSPEASASPPVTTATLLSPKEILLAASSNNFAGEFPP